MFDFLKKGPTAEEVDDIVINRLKELSSSDGMAANEAGIRGQIAAAISGGNFTGDTMHDIALDYGYPESLDFSHFWNMYLRFGIAKNVVTLPVETTWMTPPVIEGSDPFMRDLDKIIEDLNLWQRVKGLDTRQRVGRYAGMFMRVRDGKDPSMPLDTMLPGINAFVGMIPLYEGQLTVSETDQDNQSDNYGLPTMYEYNSGSTGSRDEKSASSFSIHPSRIIIAAEGADNGDIYGIPALEACYNSLMDLRKIIGAGGEGFYKNAAQSIVFKLNDASSAKDNATLLSKFNESANDFMQNRSRRSLWTPGMDANTLDSNLTNPKDFFMNALNDVAAGTTPNTPATIIIGQQTGRLASSEDSRSFLSGINSRRQNYGNELVRNVIDWLVRNGILPASDYEVEWDDLLTLSESEKLDVANKMTDVNQKQFQSGQPAVFSAEEIREQSGYDEEMEIDEPVEPKKDEFVEPEEEGVKE